MALKGLRDGWTLALVSAGLMVVLTLYFLAIARYRAIDLDEGFYLVSSRLVGEGQIPYFGFFFHQSPLVPIVYGAWIKIFGATWASARGLSAVTAAASGVLLFAFVERETQRLAPAAAALALYVTCGFAVTFFTIVKTFALTNFLLVSAFVVLCWPPLRLTFLRLAAAGVLLGLASATRIYIIALAPVFAIWITTAISDGRLRLRSLGWFILGFALGYSPCIVLFLASPDVFLFDNLGFHALRSSGGLIGDWEQKAVTVAELLFHLRTDDGLQFTALAVVSAITFPWLRRSGKAGPLALAIAATVALVSLLPTPTFTQYYCLPMPFLIVAATLGVFAYVSSPDVSPGLRRRANIAAAAGVALFALSAFPSLRFYEDSFRFHSEGGNNYVNLSPASVIAVSGAVDRIADPGEEVISFWPGYLFQTHARALPPFNNDFGFVAGEKLDPEARRKYKVGSPAEIEPLLAAHASRIVVVGNQFAAGVPEIDDYRRMLDRYGYTVAEKVGDSEIYVYPRN